MSAAIKKISRSTEGIFLLLISLVMAVLFYKIYIVTNADFTDVPFRLGKGTMINLNDPHPAQNMKKLLQNGRYFRDQKDIDLISSTFEKARLADSLPMNNIGDLNKKQYSVNAETALQLGGESFRKRVRAERIALGFTDEDSIVFAAQQKNAAVITALNNLQMGTHAINGSVKAAGAAVPGVLVRLQLVLPQDSLYSNNVEEIDSLLTENKMTVRKVYAVDSLHNKQLQSLTAYAQTDAQGNFSFAGLPDNRTYQVLPLQMNYAFGLPQGVEKLDHEASFNFY